MPVLLLALALAAGVAAADPAPVALPLAQQATKSIDGFRSARFRTSPSEVRAAIRADFPGATIVERFELGEGTKVLQVVVPNLDPGPGEATISYVFGATSLTLAQVSVTWMTRGEATADDRQAIALAGLRLGDFLRTGPQPKAVLAPEIVKDGAVSLYGALDSNGAAIELLASGVPYGTDEGPAAAPTGPAALRLLYMANPANPDVR
jgi:hypothetical protein